MLRIICALLFCFTSVACATESSSDSYLYRNECPQVGSSLPADVFNFRKCQCTSYVAHKLNERWGNTSPKFTNQYYGDPAWSDAKNWFNRAQQHEIGVTGATDNFFWEESAYNAVFPGDVAYWDFGQYGHVAYVESATRGPNNRGIGCVTFSEYNYSGSGYEFGLRTLCRNSNGTFPSSFPKYFLHIDKDRIYCLAHPTIGSCPTLLAGQKVADGPGAKVGGIGGGSDIFNLKVNSFAAWDAGNVQLISDVSTVKQGQTITVKAQVKAVSGNTKDHMRAGKDTIEVDLYSRTDDNEWVFQKRAYIQTVNLPNGATHTESITYIVPQGVGSVSFKVKIDAEDEAYESNEGDNWSRIETFSIYSRRSFAKFLEMIED